MMVTNESRWGYLNDADVKNHYFVMHITLQSHIFAPTKL
jgi:hypothetical protein